MISIDRHGPVGRTYEEDDDIADETKQQPEQLHFRSRNGAPDRDIQLLIVGTDTASSVLVARMIADYQLSAVGSIENTAGTVHCKVYYNIQNKCCLITVENELPIQLLHQAVKIIFTFHPQFVLTLGTLSVANYHTDCDTDGCALRKLVTGKATAEWARVGSAIDCIRGLEIGNIVSGMPAAFATYCEARDLPSITLLSVVSASVSLQEMKAFEQAWPVYETLSSVTLKRPTSDDYRKMAKSSTFLQVTENLYC